MMKLIHYVVYPIPWLFGSESMVNSANLQPHYLQNGVLYSLFFIHHIITALIIFKSAVFKIYPKYPLYQRLVFNCSSSLCYLIILEYAEPISGGQDLLFSTPPFFSIIGICGLGMFFHAMNTLGDFFTPAPLSKIWS